MKRMTNKIIIIECDSFIHSYIYDDAFAFDKFVSRRISLEI